ncbi:MAG: FAD/NAD(P)-binding protein [Deltaproteobacteria bacterium]|nr:FAD/NAD(P)-binding protein [Nannocystaceae bacterium]
MLDVVVVGAGIHGTHVAATLLHRGLPRRGLRILDGEDAPLAAWRRNTQRVGMQRLRSGAMHDIDPRPLGLHHFAESNLREYGHEHAFAGPQRRPSLAMFDAHADDVVVRAGLAALCDRARMTSLRRARDGWRVVCDIGELLTRRVVLAIGRGSPRQPEWARALAACGAAVGHVFDTAAPRCDVAGAGRVVIIGGGLSATQLAIACAVRYPGRVLLLRRREPPVQILDADAVWTGARRLPRFMGMPIALRRHVIETARHTGSITPGASTGLARAVARGALTVQTGEVVAARREGTGMVLSTAGGDHVEADAVLLATGFSSVGRLPWVETMAQELELERAACGGAVLDSKLEWAEGLGITGELAELSLGPMAPNIAGARLAAVRLGRAG